MSQSVSLGVESVSVQIPVLDAAARSLKNRLLHQGTGGRIGRASGRGLIVRALHDVSLAFGHGDRIGLMGRNGAGKTTLLRVLAGAYMPTHGRAWRRGRVAALLDVSLGMDPSATGYENIMARAMLLGLSHAEARQRVEEVAEFCELGDYLAMPIQAWSAGMRMRLGFAICTSIDPDILLLDEWLGVGDPAFAVKARQRLLDLVERAGIFVLASQNLQLLSRVCDRGVLLHAGEVVACGPIHDVVARFESELS